MTFNEWSATHPVEGMPAREIWEEATAFERSRWLAHIQALRKDFEKRGLYGFELIKPLTGD